MKPKVWMQFELRMGAAERIREVAEIVKYVFPDCELTFGASGGDNRSYRVSFTKINNLLPGFQCRWTALEGAHELRRLFERIEMRLENFEASPYTRLKCLKHLIRTGQLDENYFWKA